MSSAVVFICICICVFRFYAQIAALSIGVCAVWNEAQPFSVCLSDRLCDAKYEIDYSPSHDVPAFSDGGLTKEEYMCEH